MLKTLELAPVEVVSFFTKTAGIPIPIHGGLKAHFIF
jgi:hypothetical protein